MRGGRSTSGIMRFRVITKVASSAPPLTNVHVSSFMPRGSGWVRRPRLPRRIHVGGEGYTPGVQFTKRGRSHREGNTNERGEGAPPLRAHFMSCWRIVLAYRPSGDGHTSP